MGLRRPKLTACAFVSALLALAIGLVQQTVWWAGLDVTNCAGCAPSIDWSREATASFRDAREAHDFKRDGVVVLHGVLDEEKVASLATESDAMPTTMLTDIVTNLVLRHYLKYEHRIDSRSGLVRDWAVHSPLGKWAAELMGVAAVRLYNAEIIYHKGKSSPTPCRPAWHRDTVAAPFAPEWKAVTFNVYLEDVGVDTQRGDGLIFMSGSHLNVGEAPAVDSQLIEPSVRVGDILAHDPNVYHSPSGRGCWRRRSLQFRYVEDGARFAFDAKRMHGPIPWTLAHSPELAPHGLQVDDQLRGPYYPLVSPEPIPGEHAPFPGGRWSLLELFGLMSKSQSLMMNNDTGLPMASQGFFALEGRVTKSEDWALIQLDGTPVPMLMHKRGETYKAHQASVAAHKTA